MGKLTRGAPWYRRDMGDVVNLNRARKRKEREAAQAKADANAVRFGRTKAERDAAKALEAIEERRLDGAKRTVDDTSDDDA